MQYIRAIRSFPVISNLGCRGVNPRGPHDTGKRSLPLRGSFRSVGKSALSGSGKFQVNKNAEEILVGSRVGTGQGPSLRA
jgi:hypothetical protein